MTILSNWQSRRKYNLTRFLVQAEMCQVEVCLNLRSSWTKLCLVTMTALWSYPYRNRETIISVLAKPSESCICDKRELSLSSRRHRLACQWCMTVMIGHSIGIWKGIGKRKVINRDEEIKGSELGTQFEFADMFSHEVFCRCGRRGLLDTAATWSGISWMSCDLTA